MLSVALTPDGKWVLSGSKDRGVQFWDPQTASAQLMLQGHKNSGMLSFVAFIDAVVHFAPRRCKLDTLAFGALSVHNIDVPGDADRFATLGQIRSTTF